jgi:phosphatidylglycerol:prolipoprotein diacylglycerol transferase
VEPVVGELAGVTVRAQGLFAAIGLAFGLVVALRLGRRAGLDRAKLVDVVLWVVIASLLGAKLVALAVDWRGLALDPWAWLDVGGRSLRIPRGLLIWQGGLVYYGGLAGGVLAAALYLRSRGGMTLGEAGDVIAPGLSLGHAWGRLGCFLVGSCYGKAGGGVLGVAYGPGTQAFEDHQALGLLPSPLEATYALHPVQLYEAGVELLISGALLVWVLPRRRAPGQVALAYVGAYSAARLALEVFRGDRARGFLSDPTALVELNRWLGVDGGSPTLLSVSQGFALVALLACGWIWLLASSRRRRLGRRSTSGRVRPGAVT